MYLNIHHLISKSSIQKWFRQYLWQGVGVFLVLIGIGSLLFLTLTSSEAYLEEQADIVIEACKDDAYRPACYDVEIPKAMDRGLTLEEVFKLTALIQEKDSGYWYCHVLGHNVSAKEAAKDIAKWTDVVARCPQGMCSNGCLHGAFQERFRGAEVSDEELESLIPEVAEICQGEEGVRDFTGLEQASCYHALGHLTMYITNAEIDRAIEVCDRVTAKKEQDGYEKLCYDGAFMQIYQPLEPEDIALVQDIAPETQGEAVQFCNTFTGALRTSCMMETWPLFVDEFTTKDGAIEAFCERDFSSKDRIRCLNGVFYVLSARSGFNEENIDSICRLVSDRNKAQCYANSASRFLETDYKLAQKAVAVCEGARAEGVSEECFNELLFYSAYNYHPTSEAFVRLCEAMPAPWNQRCLNNEGANMRVPFYDES